MKLAESIMHIDNDFWLEPVQEIARKYPYLFSHPLRFWEQEQNEIRAMSAASEITEHIWVSLWLYTAT